MLNQDELKRMAAAKAVEFVPEDEYIGVGTGSTVLFFVEELAKSRKNIKGVVATSPVTSAALAAHGIPEVRLNDVGSLSVYVDGADEVNHVLQMIKGGGGALLSEKIVAAASRLFVCIADESKYVRQLGKYPLPVEVVPQARSLVARSLLKLGGEPEMRIGFTTEHGNEILDVAHLTINEPVKMEEAINAIIGVVDNGIFARRPADLLLLARQDGVAELHAEV